MSFGKYNDYTSILIRFAYMKHTLIFFGYVQLLHSESGYAKERQVLAL